MMIKPTIALTALLLASACGTRTAPGNVAVNQAVAAPQPVAMPAAVSNSANAAAPTAAKPQADAATEPSGGMEEAADDSDQSAATSSPARGCAAETSLGAAEELVRVCQEVSPATHPPCNIQNSCATIRQEINRSCRLLGSDAPEECRGG